MKIFTLHHDKCLPGHMLMDSQCMCNTNAKVILCQGHSGLLLAVSTTFSIIKCMESSNQCLLESTDLRYLVSKKPSAILSN